MKKITILLLLLSTLSLSGCYDIGYLAGTGMRYAGTAVLLSTVS